MKERQKQIVRCNFFILVIIFHLFAIIPYIYVDTKYEMSFLYIYGSYFASLSVSLIYLRAITNLKKRFLQLLIIYIFFILVQLATLLVSKHHPFENFPNVFRLYFYLIIFFPVFFSSFIILRKYLFSFKIDKIINFTLNYFIDYVFFIIILFIDIYVFFEINIQSLYFLIPIFLMTFKTKKNIKQRILFYILFFLLIIGMYFFIYNLFWLNQFTNWDYYFKFFFNTPLLGID